MKRMVTSKDGTLNWVEKNIEGRITAFFGSKKNWESIPKWEDMVDEANIKTIVLNHGYQIKEEENYTIEDMNEVATFRGGKCLSEKFIGMKDMLEWECAFKHRFTASPLLVMHGGHWCPECEAPPWNYDKIAKKNPFLAQAYHVNHDEEENNFYSIDCYKDIDQ